MGMVVDAAEPLRVDVAVHLRGRERAVTEQFLDRAEIGAALEQVRGEGMPQAMRVLDEAAQGRGIETSPARGDEQRVLRAARELGSCVAEVARDEQRRFFAERNDAVLAALAFAHVYALLLEVDVAEVEADCFGGAQPGRVHELEECAVPETERPVAS